MSYNKPLPKINADNRPFWEGCRVHELRFQRCKDCGHVRWPPSDLCPACHSTDSGWLISKGTGRIYTFAVYHVAYHTAFTTNLPYAVAVVALDEGPRLLTNIVDCQIDQIKCDMPVSVIWEDVNEEITLPKFTPLASEPV